MIARVVPFAFAAFLALSAAAGAQTATPQTQPQTPPNAGAAEANPQTVTGPGGATTLPASGSQTSPAAYGPDPNSGNGFTASPPLGPQQHIGRAINRTVHYITGNMIAPPIVYDPYSAGDKGLNSRSYEGEAVFELPVGGYDLYVGGEARKYVYPTTAGLVTSPFGRTYVPSYDATDWDEDVRIGLKVTGPRVYGAVSYLRRGTTNAEPTEHGIGYGIEKLADVDQNFSLHGSVFYYPNLGGDENAFGTGYGVSYRDLRYLIGISLQPNHSPVFVDAGFLGDRSYVRTDAPVGFNHQGPYVGLGIHF